MEYKTAEIAARTPPNHKEPLSRVAFAFNPGQPTLNQSRNNYETGAQGYCWLAIQAKPFDGWMETFLIEFSFPNERYGDYRVSPTPQPMQADDWLWFPVTQQPGITAL